MSPACKVISALAPVLTLNKSPLAVDWLGVTTSEKATKYTPLFIDINNSAVGFPAAVKSALYVPGCEVKVPQATPALNPLTVVWPGTVVS